MKKGQASVLLIVILAIIAIALIVLAVNSFNKNSGVTGNVIKETKEIYSQTPQVPKDKVILSSTGIITFNSVAINPPLYANSWSIGNSSIALEIKNIGGEILNLRNIEISNCGSEYIDRNIEVDEITIVRIPCNIVNAESYRGEITLYYSK